MTTRAPQPRAESLRHLRAYGITDLSPLGESVADILGKIAGGLHNYHGMDLRAIDWRHSAYIEVRWGGRGLATFDWNTLTTLVFLAHDLAVRVEIVPRSRQYLTLIFHPRTRTGASWERHPSIDQAVVAHRTHFPSPLDVELPL